MGQTDVADQFSDFSSFSECLEIRIGDLLQKVRSEEKLEIENLIDKKLDKFLKVFDYEKVQTAIFKLEKKIEDVMDSNENHRMAEKYKKLKESVKENEEKKWEKLTAANIEKQKWKTAHDKIRKEMEDLNERINELESENRDLKEELKTKNESVSGLKFELDGSRGRLEELVSKNNKEYRALKKTIERHIEILNASLSAAKISLVPDQWQRNPSQI
ncbi:putative leucine-rich repeat-containing protein DDB_G0290503 [Saccostrea cucullata]|uniref:putative leucine-rich repeat-containing protein DDB_G0290503 n=1 Tax=Saccostrea cuccullata TaxID=36930 RepID=UPI002ED4A076